MSQSAAGRAIGFVGLGNMGGRMTRRLVAAGIRVDGLRRPARPGRVGRRRSRRVARCGMRRDRGGAAVAAGQPGGGVRGARDEPAADGLLEFARPGQVLIDLSTSAPSSTQRIAAALAERGVHYLDAGISGGAAAAEKGTLTIMAGGEAAVLDSVRWCSGRSRPRSC